MTPQKLRIIVKIAFVAATLLTLAPLAYALWLMFVGQAWTTVTEGSTQARIVFEPHPASIIPLTACLLLLFGLLTRKITRPPWLTWVIIWPSFGILVYFAIAFRMGIGGILIPLAALLLILLLIAFYGQRTLGELSEQPLQQ